MAASNAIKKLSDDTFDEGVSQGLVLVDFYADWCGPCRMLTPLLEELAEEMNGKVSIVKIDTDHAINTATRFEVSSIPTMILFKNGKPLKKVVGLKDLDFLRKMVSEAM